jgi:hypothetical protein
MTDGLNDADLQPWERRLLREFSTARRALDGRLVWPTDELPSWIQQAAALRQARVAVLSGVD